MTSPSSPTAASTVRAAREVLGPILRPTLCPTLWPTPAPISALTFSPPPMTAAARRRASANVRSKSDPRDTGGGDAVGNRPAGGARPLLCALPHATDGFGGGSWCTTVPAAKIPLPAVTVELSFLTPDIAPRSDSLAETSTAAWADCVQVCSSHGLLPSMEAVVNGNSERNALIRSMAEAEELPRCRHSGSLCTGCTLNGVVVGGGTRRRKSCVFTEAFSSRSSCSSARRSTSIDSSSAMASSSCAAAMISSEPVMEIPLDVRLPARRSLRAVLISRELAEADAEM